MNDLDAALRRLEEKPQQQPILLQSIVQYLLHPDGRIEYVRGWTTMKGVPKVKRKRIPKPKIPTSKKGGEVLL